MKKIALLFALALVFSCNKKVVQLPEISHSNITELEDVSAAYLFYNETKSDSVELNRKNLISTTNWLVNVDKRLNLKQAIPHIKFLQDKKANAGHKNEKAKNYFTCHDTSRNNLGFLEFTNVEYHEEESSEYFKKVSQLRIWSPIYVKIKKSDEIMLMGFWNDSNFQKSNTLNLIDDLESILKDDKLIMKIILDFDKNISFQDYISIKTQLSDLKIENLQVFEHEFIY
ncbi:hypothetical protein [Seonamhaeicola maritimus]|uniref:hypothetical protein n=1 Tax=Seonamhaeicola maritimus TaxID=2591822 RepID=UPI0024947F67|nr:hypothetical protein [Seonamhaeicola maritimus]